MQRYHPHRAPPSGSSSQCCACTTPRSMSQQSLLCDTVCNIVTVPCAGEDGRGRCACPHGSSGRGTRTSHRRGYRRGGHAEPPGHAAASRGVCQRCHEVGSHAGALSLPDSEPAVRQPYADYPLCLLLIVSMGCIGAEAVDSGSMQGLVCHSVVRVSSKDGLSGPISWKHLLSSVARQHPRCFDAPNDHHAHQVSLRKACTGLVVFALHW